MSIIPPRFDPPWIIDREMLDRPTNIQFHRSFCSHCREAIQVNEVSTVKVNRVFKGDVIEDTFKVASAGNCPKCNARLWIGNNDVKKTVAFAINLKQLNRGYDTRR